MVLSQELLISVIKLVFMFLSMAKAKIRIHLAQAAIEQFQEDSMMVDLFGVILFVGVVVPPIFVLVAHLLTTGFLLPAAVERSLVKGEMAAMKLVGIQVSPAVLQVMNIHLVMEACKPLVVMLDHVLYHIVLKPVQHILQAGFLTVQDLLVLVEPTMVDYAVVQLAVVVPVMHLSFSPISK